jgi:proteasome activator subunit 4
MKSLRYIKHRSYSRGPAEMAQGIRHNPLKVKIPVRPSHSLTAKLLRDFNTPINSKGPIREPLVVYSIPVTANLMHI